MVAEFGSPLATGESRLCEISRELARLRREQRLFRRIGFAENFKVMQIVTLQMERQECLAALPAAAGSRRPRLPAALARAAVGHAAGLVALGLGLLLVAARALLTSSARQWLPLPQPRRAGAHAAIVRGRLDPRLRPRPSEAETAPTPLYWR